MSSTEQWEKVKKIIEEYGYFGIETDPFVDMAVSKFTESETPNLHGHYSDNDENAGQLLRVRLSEYIRSQRQQVRRETIEEIRRWTKGKTVTKDKLREYLNSMEK